MAWIKKAFKAVSKAMSAAFIFPIRLYQKYISANTPPRCKYYPTCSAYAVTAYQKHGVIMGSVLTAWRLLRCNPWSMGGVDHVPDKITRIYFVPKKKHTDAGNAGEGAENRAEEEEQP